MPPLPRSLPRRERTPDSSNSSSNDAIGAARDRERGSGGLKDSGSEAKGGGRNLAPDFDGGRAKFDLIQLSVQPGAPVPQLPHWVGFILLSPTFLAWLEFGSREA